MDNVVEVDDRFLVAWGEAESWRGYEARANLLASLSTTLIASSPAEIFRVAHALGNAHALRHHIVRGIDQLLPSLRAQYLNKGLREVRSSRRGPARWRRYWLARVVTYAGSIEDELNAAVSAQTSLVSWSRALTVAQEGIAAAGALIPAPPPVLLCRDWENLSARMTEEAASLSRLDERIGKLMEGLQAQRAKGEALLEVCDAVPTNEDVLRSTTLQGLVRDLDNLRASGIPGALE